MQRVFLRSSAVCGTQPLATPLLAFVARRAVSWGPLESAQQGSRGAAMHGEIMGQKNPHNGTEEVTGSFEV
jgi:hypothetical protein